MWNCNTKIGDIDTKLCYPLSRQIDVVVKTNTISVIFQHLLITCWFMMMFKFFKLGVWKVWNWNLNHSISDDSSAGANHFTPNSINKEGPKSKKKHTNTSIAVSISIFFNHFPYFVAFSLQFAFLFLLQWLKNSDVWFSIRNII